MNTTGHLTCPRCGERLLINYDDVCGFSIDSCYFPQQTITSYTDYMKKCPQTCSTTDEKK